MPTNCMLHFDMHWYYPNTLFPCERARCNIVFPSFRVVKSMVCDADDVPIKSWHSAQSLSSSQLTWCHWRACHWRAVIFATVGLCHCWADILPLKGHATVGLYASVSCIFLGVRDRPQSPQRNIPYGIPPPPKIKVKGWMGLTDCCTLKFSPFPIWVNVHRLSQK